MTKKSANDNIEAKGLFYNNSIENLPYANLASYLVDKYTNHYWKNDKNGFEYCYVEWKIADKLYTLENIIPTTGMFELLASALNVDVLKLYNDPKLDRFPRQRI